MSSNSDVTTNNEDDKEEEVEIVSVDVMDVSKKIQEIRTDVPFIKDVMKAHRLALNECQYTKLEKLVQILAQNENVSVTALNKIENVIGKLKSRFSSLLAPIETIDISNDIATTSKSQIPSTTNKPNSSTSAIGSPVESSPSRPPPNEQPSSSSKDSTTTAKLDTKPKTGLSAQELEAQKDVMRTRNPSPSALPSTSKPQELGAQKNVIRKRNPSPTALPSSSKSLQATMKDLLTPELNQPTKPTQENTFRQSSSTADAMINKSGSSNDPLRRTSSASPSNAFRRFNTSPPCGSEKNSPVTTSVNDIQKTKTSVEEPKSSQSSTSTPNGVATKNTTSCDFVRRTIPIVLNDYIRRINPSPPHESVKDNSLPARVEDTTPTPSRTSVEASSSRQPVSIPNESTSANSSTSCDFVRRIKPTVGDFTRRSNPCNPVPPQITTIAPDFTRRSQTETEKELQPANSLEEARKKLAALRGDIPLASNSNDPRGRKPNYTSSLAATTQLPKIDISKAVWPRTTDISTAAAGDVPIVPILSVPTLPVPTLPVPAPIPPVHIPHNTSAPLPITNVRGPSFNLNSNQRPISRTADLQQSPPLGAPGFVQGRNYATSTVSPTADVPPLNGSSPNAPPEVRRDPRWPNKYFTDSRNQNNNYKNDFNKTTWNNNGHANGPHSIHNHSPSRVGTKRPNDQVHTTYREHREAKARAEAAEAAEQQRQFMMDLKRQQEAEKKRQCVAAQKQREVEDMKEKTSVAQTSAPVTDFQFDTSYRNCDLVGAPAKKIVFRIPKITTTVSEHSKDMLKDSQNTKDKTCQMNGNDVAEASDKKSPVKNSESPDRHIVNQESESPLSSSSKEEVSPKEVNQDRNKHKSEKSEKTKSSDKTKKHRKHRSTSESGKHGIKADREKEMVDQQDKERNKKLTTKIKIVGLTGPSPKTKVVINRDGDSSQEREIKDGEGETIDNGNEVKDHKTPIKSRITRRNTVAQIAIKPLVDDDDDPVTQANEKGLRRTRSKPNSLDETDTATSDIKTSKRHTLPEVTDEPVETPQRIQKRRNTLAPIAVDRFSDKSQSGPNDNCSVSTHNTLTGTRRTQESEVMDQPAPAKPARILKRRNTMAPIASEPLVDKHELFNNCSMLYEDMQECQRVAREKGIQLSRSVANLFEKTSDNCSVSTQNIIAGKRRKRGDDVSFNETLLSRNSFKMGPITKTGTKNKVNSNENLATEVTSAEDATANDIIKNPGKRKRGKTTTKKSTKKPSLDNENDLTNDTTNVTDDQKDKPATDNAPRTSKSANVPPRKPRRPKRNELEKLNEDIAQMYCAEEVMRASGRRTCTQQPLHVLTNDDSTNSDSIRIRNVARRGVPFSRGPRSASDGCNRATFLIKKCRIRLSRCVQLETSLKNTDANVESAINESANNKGILNTNPDWHALSSVINQCVICDRPIKKYNSVHHYIQHHGEPFGARFAPGMLNEMRMNRGNRPVYCLKQITNSSKSLLRYHYTCPFCKRTADLSTSDWYDHLAQHTGELRYRCSKCHKQFHRRCAGQLHFKSCSSDADLIHNESYTNRAPIIVYVCRLCEFVQKSRKNMVKHLKIQHGIDEDETNDKVKSILETIQIYHLENVPKAQSKNVDTPTVKVKPLSIKLPLSSKKHKKKRKILPKKRFRLMAKKFIGLVKTETSINEAKENEPPMDSEEIIIDTPMPMVILHAQQIINEPLLEDTEDMPAEAHIATINGREEREELILPDPEPMLVINECKFESKENSLEEPQQTIDEEISFLGPHSEKQKSTSPSKAAKIMNIIEINGIEDNLSGIGSDITDELANENENNINKSKEKNENVKATEEWIDLEKRNKQTKKKSIFGKFNLFCTRLKKNGDWNVRTKPAKCIGGSSTNESNHLPSDDHGELMPKMTALDPPAMDTAFDLDTIPAAHPPPVMAPPIRVENVGFRRGSYFCFFPRCTFLFSNEVEGLENHFALEHPSVRWSGKCSACEQDQPQAPASNSSHLNCPIAQELSHMVKEHMEKSSTSFAKQNEIKQSAPQPVETEPQSLEPSSVEPQALEPQSLAPQSLESHSLEPQPPAAQPAAPKLRVRRFSGDRLVSEVEKDRNSLKVNSNTMLKDLLNSTPRPPNQQTIDFNAAGLGEFLQTKNFSQPEPVLVNNHASGLSLSINQVFSLVQSSTSPERTGDFIVTQSCLSKNLDDQTPAQINISITPATPSIPVSVPVSAPRLGHARVPSVVVADRFRCMAPNCGFCAHTVMCIRQHMKFHSYSFGSNDYLKCAYCSHIGADVNDYVRHGVTVHGLASVTELESERADSITTTVAAAAPAMETPAAPLSVTDQIREVFNQRNRQSLPPTTTVSTPLAPATSMTTGTVIASAPVVAITAHTSAASKVINEILQPTGYCADKLYACPYKGCSGSLNQKNFVSHIRYHLAIAHNQDADVKCKFCNICLMPAELLNHLQRFHGRHTVFCAICLATTLNRRIMHTHIKSKHEASFLLANRQLHFLSLSCENVEETIELAAIEHPFGKSQLENFHHRLNNEWLKRLQNTKVSYRHSEVRLLPKMSTFPNYLKCGDCNKYESRERRTLQMHLYTHKANEVAEAYTLVNSVPDTPTNSQEQPSSSATNSVNPNPNVPPVDIVTHLIKPIDLYGEPPKPGQQQIVLPKLVFVPPEKLYHCGSSKCSQSMSTDLDLRHHLATDHSYKDVLSCFHCKHRVSHKSTADTLIDHLEMHKQYIYQCGGCPRYGHKRVAIDRHIQERHQDSDVDVIIYKRDKIGTGMSAAKWFKASKPPISDLICNLCQLSQQTDDQMMAHVMTVHEKRHQYYCQYCLDDFIDPVLLIRHILMRHPDKPVEPVQVYQRLSVKNRNTLGFYCLKCKEVTNTRQKISTHCELMHQSKYQFKCPHCDFGHSLERYIANHMFEKHPFSPGRAIIQFERVANYVPDNICWTLLARDFEYDPANPARHQLYQTQQQQKQQPIVVDEVELISSDEETPIEKIDHFKSIQFACSYCQETSNDVVQLRLDHWANNHADQPFYFRVQPQLLCPECKSFQGNAKTLLEEHLTKVHGIRQIVACDVRRPQECAYCEYRYTDCNDLFQHMNNMGHRANDLKNITDDELRTLRTFGTDQTTMTKNEYYQCVICKVIMPTCIAMGQHGRVQHSDAANFCFRRLTEEVIYHCFYCMYASTDEKQTLRHMLDHYSRYKQCQFCQGQALPMPGFDGYVKHRAVHSYADLKKYLMEIHYQFQNGLIITKSSLRHTKFSDENVMKSLDMELMRRTTSGYSGQPLAKRRKTACTDEIRQPNMLAIAPTRKVPIAGGATVARNGGPLTISRGPGQIAPRIVNRAFVTSFTGRDTTSAPSASAPSASAPSASAPSASAPSASAPSASAPSASAPPASAPSASSTGAAAAATERQTLPVRILKRRFTVIGENLNACFLPEDK